MLTGAAAESSSVNCDVAGQHDRQSVLDKVVPGYYYRRMENGDICMSTCCNNTASEHGMCERLIIDDIVHWAREYKVSPTVQSEICLAVFIRMCTVSVVLTPCCWENCVQEYGQLCKALRSRCGLHSLACTSARQGMLTGTYDSG